MIDIHRSPDIVLKNKHSNLVDINGKCGEFFLSQDLLDPDQVKIRPDP